MKALICGSGISGLTLAWHLERAGWEVELVERAPAFRESGHLIDFFGPGREVADRMGLLPRLLDVRYPVTGIGYVDGAGRTTSLLTMPPDTYQVISLLRGELARAIQDQVRSPIRYGTSVAVAERSDTAVTVRLTDGTLRSVDLLVGADGAHSRVRELVFGPEHRFQCYLDHQVSAYILADELAHGEVPDALARYEERMRPAVEEVQRAGRRFVKWMAPATRRHITARDLMIRLAGLPGLGRLFVSSLSPGGHRLITSRADHLDRI